jgi:glycosyltransferase involved in cell wall biosynthesis
LPGASHAQLHGGLLADAFRADAMARGPLHLRLLPLALRLNGRRRALLAQERAMLAGGTRLMVWSDALRERLLDRGVAGERIEVALPGIDLGRFPPAPPPAPAAHLRLLFVAHNPRLKGLLPLLDGLTLASREAIDFRLRVVGPSGGWHRHVAAQGLESRVELLGPLPGEAIATALAGSDALVHPTFHDPCSLVALEALACGCPVVTTRANGAAATVAGAGFLLDSPSDAAGLLHALRELSDPATRAHLRAAALGLRDRLDMAAHARRVTEWLAA